MPDPTEARIGALEWHQQDLYARLARTEEAYTSVTAKCQTLLEGLLRCHNWNRDLASNLSLAVPESTSPIHKDLSVIQEEIGRSIESLRAIEDHDAFGNGRSSIAAAPVGHGMMSPRQHPFDESRRPSLQNIARPSSFRPAMSGHTHASPRRYGSIGAINGTGFSPSASSTRTFLPPPPPPLQPPLAPSHPASHQQQHLHHYQPPPTRGQSPPPPLPNLARRHTSADIRVHGWQGGQTPAYYNQGSSPYASGQNSSAWPSSPRTNPADQQIRDTMAQYDLSRAQRVGSRQASPPAPDAAGVPTFTNSFSAGTATSSYANTSNEAGWQIPGAKYPFRGLDTPGPPTRRSSMASNVHSLLNPADTAEKEGEDEGPDERKRKRVV